MEFQYVMLPKSKIIDNNPDAYNYQLVVYLGKSKVVGQIVLGIL